MKDGVTLAFTLGVILGFPFIIYWAARKLIFYVPRKTYPDYDREISPKSQAYLDELSSAVYLDSQQKNYPWHFSLVLNGITPVLIGMTIFFGVMFWLSRLLQKTAFDAILLLSVFGGVFLASCTSILLARRNYLFLQYLYYKLGWGTLSSSERPYAKVREDAEDAYRKRQIKYNHDGFDVEAINKTLFERVTGFWQKGLIFFIAVSLLCLLIS